MAKKAAGGRPALYQPKDGKVQVRAITKKGARMLESVRAHVKRVSKWPGKVSDGDAIDYVLRHWAMGSAEADADLRK